MPTQTTAEIQEIVKDKKKFRTWLTEHAEEYIKRQIMYLTTEDEQILIDEIPFKKWLSIFLKLQKSFLPQIITKKYTSGLESLEDWEKEIYNSMPYKNPYKKEKQLLKTLIQNGTIPISEEEKIIVTKHMIGDKLSAKDKKKLQQINDLRVPVIEDILLEQKIVRPQKIGGHIIRYVMKTKPATE